MTLQYLSGNRIQGTSADRFTSSLSLTTGSTETGMTANTVRGFGNRFGSSHAIIGKTVTKVTIDFKGSQSGTITVGVYDASGVLLLTLGTLDANVLTSSFVSYTFENQTGAVMKTNYIIGWSVSGNTATGVIARRTSASADANIEGTVVNDSGTWTGAGSGDPNQDYNMIVYTVPTTLSSLQDNARLEETDTETIYRLISSTNPVFSDNFSSNSGWVSSSSTDIDVNTGTGVIDAKTDTASETATMVYNLGYDISEMSWMLRAKLTISALSTNTNAQSRYVLFGISDSNAISSGTHDAIAFVIQSASSVNSFRLRYSDSTNLNGTTDVALSESVDASDVWYVELIRTSSTSIQVNLYSDSAFTTLVESKSGICVSTVDGLKYLLVGNASGGSSNGSITITIDDLKLYNGVSNIPNWWVKQ